MLNRHEPCIRRRNRHEHVLPGVRIHPEIFETVIRRVSRCAEPWTKLILFAGRSLVGLLFTQNPVSGLGQMTSYGNGGPAMSSGWLKSVVEVGR